MNGKGYHFGRDPVTVGSDVGNLHEGYDDGLVVLGSIASPVLLSLSLSHTFIYTRHITRILTEFTGFYRVIQFCSRRRWNTILKIAFILVANHQGLDQKKLTLHDVKKPFICKPFWQDALYK